MVFSVCFRYVLGRFSAEMSEKVRKNRHPQRGNATKPLEAFKRVSTLTMSQIHIHASFKDDIFSMRRRAESRPIGNDGKKRTGLYTHIRAYRTGGSGQSAEGVHTFRASSREGYGDKHKAIDTHKERIPHSIVR